MSSPLDARGLSGAAESCYASVTVPSSVESIRLAAGFIVQAARNMRVPAASDSLFEVAIVEALTNAFKHGNTAQRAGASIVCELELADHRLTVRILDQGAGFVLPPTPEWSAGDVATIPVSGFGLPIIQGVFPVVRAIARSGGFGLEMTLTMSAIPPTTSAVLDEAAGGVPDAGAEVRHKEALLKTGALQNAIFTSANFSSIATDEKGVIQIFNVGAEQMLGYAAADVVNKITPADISDPQELIARAAALSLELATTITPGFEALVFKASRGIEDIYELTYIRKDGSRFPAIVSVTALRDDHDGIIGYLLIGTDNTARKRAEEALLEAGALQSAIFNSVNFSSIATDEKGVIQIFNVGAERMLGYAAADVMNTITPADISDPLEGVARAAALSAELGTTITPGFEALVFKASRGIEDIYELTYIRKDGSRFPAIVSVTALRDDQDSIIGYLLIGTDNTARKHVEADRKYIAQMLQEKNVELEAAKSVAERTVERLEKVERLNKGFLSTVSHELRTPLTSIRGALGLLASGAVGTLSDEVVEVVAIAERNAVRLMALINDILDLERLETGKIELQFAQVQVESILRRAIESLSTFGQKHGVTVEAPEASSMIWADEDRIVQVLVNLLSNAVKFSPPRGVVTIGVVVMEGWVEFRVSDRGRGVPLVHRRAIFERFRQVETSDAREKGGTGLGLAICKSIVEHHGGSIGVESEEGSGSTFWFRVATASGRNQDSSVPLVLFGSPLVAGGGS